MKYEYYLKSWGGIYDTNFVEQELGTTETDFWFDTADERTKFKKTLKEITDRHYNGIAFSEYEGTETRKRTIATMTMVFPDGTKYPYKYDFGYAYPEDSAEFIFFDGNYSCDCNKSIFISAAYPDVPEFECGDEIKLENFNIIKV